MSASSGEPHPRFGIWAPIYGTWAGRTHPHESRDAGYRRNRDLLRRAEATGFSSVLLAEHIASPSSIELPVLETWTASAALAAETERLEIIAAVKPLLFHPGVLAKLALGIDDISGGRFAINLVSAWFRPEMGRLGIAMPEHDERYAYSGEWLDVVRRLLRGELVHHEGASFRIDGLQLRPRPVRPGGPLVYLGGESEPARRLAARSADVLFLNGRPLPDVLDVVADMRRRPRSGAALRYGLSAFVVARPDEDGARAELDELQALADLDDKSSVAAGTDPGVVMAKVGAGVARVGSNGGTLAGLVGSYDQVADRVVAFAEAGIELFMVQFQPLEEETIRFGSEVIPRVRARMPTGAR